MSWIKLSVHRIAVNHLRDIISEVSGRSMLSGLFQSYFLYRRNRAKGGPFYSQNANMVPVLRNGKTLFHPREFTQVRSPQTILINYISLLHNFPLFQQETKAELRKP